MTELLAPAGNLEKLVYAERFGADAVYFGLQQFSLRSFAGNFTLADAEAGLTHLHEHDKRGYCTLNIYPYQEEYPALLDAAAKLDEMGVDGIIVSDIGVMAALRRRGIRAPLHVSTQANTLSPQTIEVLAELGAARINLARELSLERIERLLPAIAHLDVETEVFVHGSVCFSYSGRCAISDYLTGRRANRGACTHPCRWQYHLVEEKRPGQYMPVFEDERGTYLFNSRDLALYRYVPALSQLGIHAFKLEGRMKSIHYIAQVVSLYRRILDGESPSEPTILKWLGRVKNRGYTDGFMKGAVEPDDYKFEKSTPASDAIFLGNIESADATGSILNIRNKVHAGEPVEVLKTDGTVMTLELPEPLVDVTGETHDAASHGTLIRLPQPLPPYAILRRPMAFETSCN